MPSISNLQSLTTASDNILFPVVDVNTTPDTTKKSTFGQFKSYLENSISVKSVAGKTGTVVLSYVDISGLSTVAHTGVFSDLTGRPSTYPVATATSVTLGGVKVGSGINLSNGVISVSPLATATNVTLGGVRIGSGITYTTDGTISTVPMTTASATVLGGIKIGTGLNIDTNGVVTVNTLSSNVLSPFLVINGSETSDQVSGGSAGIIIYRGTSDSARFIYTENYTIDNGLSTTQGAFGLSVGSLATATSSGLLVNNIRTTPGVNELNIFGANNPGAIITVTGTSNYEDNVTDDDHIPNKLYVDKAIDLATATVISVVGATYATTSTFGNVKIGAGIDVASGVISVTMPATYTLVTATNVRLGGIKIGSGLSVTGDGTVSAALSYVLTTATVSSLGGVKIGTGISITADGTISATTATPYSLPTASNSVLGGVKIGSGISIDGSGVISASASFSGGSVANATQFADATASTTSANGAVTIAGGLGVGKSINVANTVTAQSFVYTGSSTPEIYSASNLNLTAVGRVQVTQSPFKVWNVTTVQRDAIAASNGDMIYNTDVNKFQGYAGGTWKDITA
jgi:hypothetical protein